MYNLDYKRFIKEWLRGQGLVALKRTHVPTRIFFGPQLDETTCELMHGFLNI